MFEVEDGRTKALHHPFTMPKSLEDNIDDLEEIESIAYDIVLNGTELGGGSIRIHKEEIQSKVFKLMGISQEEKEKFGFLLMHFNMEHHLMVDLQWDLIEWLCY